MMVAATALISFASVSLMLFTSNGATRMTKITDTEVATIIDGLAALNGGVVTIASELRLHGEALARIEVLLTPENEATGPTLQDLLAQLIAQLNRQSLMLAEILGNLRNPRDAATVTGIDASGRAGGAPSQSGATGREANGASNGNNGGSQP
jgi:hypothetical protein